MARYGKEGRKAEASAAGIGDDDSEGGGVALGINNGYICIAYDAGACLAHTEEKG